MNKFKLIPIVIIVLFAISLSMCTKDDKTVAPGILPTQVNTAIVVGTWDITLYDKAGTDHTSDFSEYSFAFNVNDTVVATAATSKKGTWEAIAESSVTKIVLDLKEEGNVTILDSISKDWNVFTATETKIEMKRTSDDESIDFLTFEKN